MHNYTFSIVEADAGAATQQPHGHWENMPSHKRISWYWYWADSETVFYMSWIPAHTAAQDSTTLWHTMQTIGGSWYWCICDQ